jgi:methyl-accepting chemotaxis protein
MSIKESLGFVIKSINEFSKRTNIVAINASIHASKLSSYQGAPFHVLVREIQNMSLQSIDKLHELDGLVNEISELSMLINKTGSQRMLLMKIISNKLLNNVVIMKESCDRFESQLKEIKNSRINSPSSSRIVLSIETEWLKFLEGLEIVEPQKSYDNAIHLIATINTLIKEYENYAGE